MSEPWLGAHQQLQHLNASLGLDLELSAAAISGSEPILASRYPLASSAAAVIAAVGLAAARVGEQRGGNHQQVAVTTRHAGALMRGFYDMQLDGAVLDPDPTNQLPLAGIYRAADGRWLQLYGVMNPRCGLAGPLYPALIPPSSLRVTSFLTQGHRRDAAAQT